MKLLSWNINSLPPTTSNVVLKYGSWENFFSNLELDVVCLQVHKIIRDLVDLPRMMLQDRWPLPRSLILLTLRPVNARRKPKCLRIN